MVRGDQVNGSICQPLYNGNPVCFFPKGRVHLRHSSFFHCRLLGQRKVMRRCFRMYVHSLFFCPPHQLHRLFCTDMLNHDLCAGSLGKPKVTFHHGNFCLPGRTSNAVISRCLPCMDAIVADQCRIFLMEAYGFLKLPGAFHCLPHQLFSQKRNTVVRKACRTTYRKLLHIRQRFPFHPLGHIGTGMNMNACPFTLIQYIRKCL